jgi:hypothetical protein
MGHHSKRNREIAKVADVTKTYSVKEAIDILKKCPVVKFDQELALTLVDRISTFAALCHYRMAQASRSSLSSSQEATRLRKP